MKNSISKLCASIHQGSCSAELCHCSTFWRNALINWTPWVNHSWMLISFEVFWKRYLNPRRHDNEKSFMVTSASWTLRLRNSNRQLEVSKPPMHTLTGLLKGMFTLINGKDKSCNHCCESSRTDDVTIQFEITRVQFFCFLNWSTNEIGFGKHIN